MAAELSVSVRTPIELADLRQWLRSARMPGGSVNAATSPPGDGALGGWTEALAVSLGSGGAVAAFAGALTAWLKTRRSDVSVRVVSKDGEVTIRVTHAAHGMVLPLLRQVIPASQALPGPDEQLP